MRRAPLNGRAMSPIVPRLSVVVAAVAIAAWLAATAVHRADDYLLVAEAWADGSVTQALHRWWDLHFGAGPPDVWPKFHRPVWRASFLLDAHALGCSAVGSVLLSWALHCATAAVLGRLVRTATGSRVWGVFAAGLCLLPAAAAEAPLWSAARGSVLATLFSLLAIAAARSGARATRRTVAVAACVALAAGSHETGFAAGPLAALAAWLHPARPPARRRVAAAAVAMLAMAGVLVWRRAMLGTWVGGYQRLTAPQWHDGPWTVASGTGAAVLPGHGALPAPAAVFAGAAVLLALGVAVAGPLARLRAHRDVVAIAGAAIVLFLAPFAGFTFRDAAGENGRALYAPYVAWTAAAAVLLHAGARVRPRLAGALAAVLACITAAAFVAMSIAYAHALRTAHTLFRAVADTPWAPGTVLLEMPGREGPFLIARNAIGPLLRPPFGGGELLPHATDEDLDTNRLAPLAAALPSLPAAAAFWWDRDAARFVAGWTPRPVSWRGHVTVDADGTVRCGGIALRDVPANAEPALAPGSWCEVHGVPRGDAGALALHPTSAQPWRPSLRPDGEQWTFRGNANEWFVLLAGFEPCCIGLGAAGTLGIVRPAVVPIRVLDSAAPFAFVLPPAVEHARLLQPLVIGRHDVRLGELHVRR